MFLLPRCLLNQSCLLLPRQMCVRTHLNTLVRWRGWRRGSCVCSPAGSMEKLILPGVRNVSRVYVRPESVCDVFIDTRSIYMELTQVHWTHTNHNCSLWIQITNSKLMCWYLPFPLSVSLTLCFCSDGLLWAAILESRWNSETKKGKLDKQTEEIRKEEKRKGIQEK